MPPTRYSGDIQPKICDSYDLSWNYLQTSFSNMMNHGEWSSYSDDYLKIYNYNISIYRIDLRLNYA